MHLYNQATYLYETRFSLLIKHSRPDNVVGGNVNKELTLPEKLSERLPAALGGHTFYAGHFLFTSNDK